jgi:hypothetical protein
MNVYMLIKDRVKSHPAIVLGIIVSVVLTFANPLIDMAAEHPFGGSLMAILIAIIVVWLCIVLLPGAVSTPPHGEKFRGIIGISIKEDSATVWPRDEVAAQVYNAIVQQNSAVVAVTGASGAGKSYLVKNQTIPQFEEAGKTCFYYSSYSDSGFRLLEELAKHSGVPISDLKDEKNDDALRLVCTRLKDVVIILDQSEVLFARRNRYRKWAARFITAVGSANRPQNILCILILRKDFFYSLRCLGSHAPRPSEVIEVPGLQIARDSIEARSLRALFAEFAKPGVVGMIMDDLALDPSTALFRVEEESQGEAEMSQILPMDAQALGLMLEDHFYRTGEMVDEATYGAQYRGRWRYMSRFFEAFLKASKDYDNAKIVLYALSADRVLRRPLTLEEISHATNVSEGAIKTLLKDFVQYGLVKHHTVEEGHNKLVHYYEWCHDGLAVGFQEYTGMSIDPVLRDNIAHSIDRLSRQPQSAGGGRTIKNADVLKGINKTCTKIMIVATIIIALRMAFNDLFHDLMSGIPYLEVPLTLEYLAVGPAHFAWGLFVYRITTSFFSRITSSHVFPGWRLLSRAGLLLVLLGALLPRLGLVCIGIQGVLLGLAYYSISKRGDIAAPSRAVFRQRGVGMFSTSLAMFLAGAAYFLQTSHIADSTLVISPVDLTFVFGAGLLFLVSGAVATLVYAQKNRLYGELGLVEREDINGVVPATQSRISG